jgi:hypothetical protein
MWRSMETLLGIALIVSIVPRATRDAEPRA